MRVASHPSTWRTLMDFVCAHSKTGRGYPDVAAQGKGYQVVVGGKVQSVGGTSASSPVCCTCSLEITNSKLLILQTFAAIVSLLNDFRISKGKAPLGFLNPVLYAKGFAGLNDIVSGSNPGCGTNVRSHHPCSLS
jgi:tripeptidyl-peptidase-1